MQTLRRAESGIVASEFELHMGRGWLTSENALVRRVNRNDANGYYKALGLSPGATREDIKAAYRRLMKRLHPDLNGDEELFRFVADIASVLLDEEEKSVYDSVGENAIYLGNMEREELARSGLLNDGLLRGNESEHGQHWACLTNPGSPPGEDTDAWIDFCWQVASVVGYRGKIRVAVIEGGRHWPCGSSQPWGLLATGGYTFVVFQRGVEPNRLHALCAMIDLQKHLLSQIRQQRTPVQDRERMSWL